MGRISYMDGVEQCPTFVSWSAMTLLPAALEKMGVRFEEWELGEVSLTGIDLENPTAGLIRQIVLTDAREQEIYDARTAEGHLQIFQLSPETPNLNDLLKTFDKRHTHLDPEIRLIIDGEGTFTIWDKQTPHDLPVQRGSFVVIPAGCVHTFKPTDTHQITALRVFQNKEGWKPQYVDPQA